MSNLPLKYSLPLSLNSSAFTNSASSKTVFESSMITSGACTAESDWVEWVSHCSLGSESY